MAGNLHTKSIFACSPFTKRGEHATIGGDPSGKKFLYVNGNSVFIRDIENPSICDVYMRHSHPTTCAKFSPSGFYIASGDSHGKLKVWSPDNLETTKHEYQPISGPIVDIAWTSDSQRLVLVGEGREKFGAAIMVSTGTSVGTIDSIAKKGNSCDIRQTRPFIAITGSDDCRVCFYRGIPFKLTEKLSKHNRFVLSTRFDPTGNLFCTAGADGMCFLYEGETGKYKSALGAQGKAHNGSVYGTAWSGDGKQLLTVSGDKTAKIWDVETGQVAVEFKLGDSVLTDQQVACLWQNDHILTMSLDGNINYLSPSDPSKPIRIIKGHQKAIKTIAVNADRSKIFSGSFDGVVNCWDVSSGSAESVEGNRPNHISQMAHCEGMLSTVGVDDTARTIDADSLKYTGEPCPLDSQPKGVARGTANVTVVAGIEKLTVIRNESKASVLDVPFTATAVDIHPNQSEVAVGTVGGDIHIFTLAGDALQEKKSFRALSGDIVKCCYSPDGEYLLAGSSEKLVEVWKVQADYEPLGRTDYQHHSKVTDVAWNTDSCHYASTSLDSSVFIWDVRKQSPIVMQKRVHGPAEASCVQWLDDHTVATAGVDCCLRISEFTC